MNRRRPEQRVPIDIPVRFVDDAGTEGYGRATDLSIGGLRIETDAPVSFASPVIVLLRLPGCADELSLPAVARWWRNGVMGLQFGLLGARETHLIAAMATGPSQTLEAEDVAWIG